MLRGTPGTCRKQVAGCLESLVAAADNVRTRGSAVPTCNHLVEYVSVLFWASALGDARLAFNEELSTTGAARTQTAVSVFAGYCVLHRSQHFRELTSWIGSRGPRLMACSKGLHCLAASSLRAGREMSEGNWPSEMQLNASFFRSTCQRAMRSSSFGTCAELAKYI